VVQTAVGRDSELATSPPSRAWRPAPRAPIAWP
jgi:hypothetical protein